MDCTGREGTEETLEGEDTRRGTLQSSKPGALRQKARNLGISIGHRQRPLGGPNRAPRLLPKWVGAAQPATAQLATFSDTGQPRMASSTTLSSCFLPTPLLACTAKPELIVMR
jgi:hypothetical protein